MHTGESSRQGEAVIAITRFGKKTPAMPVGQAVLLNPAAKQEPKTNARGRKRPPREKRHCITRFRFNPPAKTESSLAAAAIHRTHGGSFLSRGERSQERLWLCHAARRFAGNPARPRAISAALAAQNQTPPAAFAAFSPSAEPFRACASSRAGRAPSALRRSYRGAACRNRRTYRR